ncbi:hypothetical protein [Bdellovibrio svalbardensis]|uniref:Uncharacterized protein n=1 Tax=Bdellovibrio svalbardensis TaxID=2972972 RepID=A0ABT6DG41_9BACT|nr:hypothetical protein [Bdellovibrio svalbardensis]MDG0815819.1 hypothetical protein [Bdellovibrio svalbardensis]
MTEHELQKYHKVRNNSIMLWDQSQTIIGRVEVHLKPINKVLFEPHVSACFVSQLVGSQRYSALIGLDQMIQARIKANE